MKTRTDRPSTERRASGRHLHLLTLLLLLSVFLAAGCGGGGGISSQSGPGGVAAVLAPEDAPRGGPPAPPNLQEWEGRLARSAAPKAAVTPLVVPSPSPSPSSDVQTWGALDLVPGWNMVSFPVSEITELTVSSWILETAFAWDPAAGAYQPVDLRNAASVSAAQAAGRGLWVYANRAAQIQYVGWPNSGTHEHAKVNLAAGWNLLTFPYAQDQAFSGMTVEGSGSASPQPLTGSVSPVVPPPDPSVLLFSFGFEYRGQAYQSVDLSVPTDAFQVGQAVWVYVHQDGTAMYYPPGTPGTGYTVTSEEINSAAGGEWTAQDTSVTTDFSLNGARGLCGLSGEPPSGEPIQPRGFLAKQDPPLPSSLSWANHDGKNWLSPVKDQGPYGTDTAFAAVAALETMLRIQGGDPTQQFDLSESYFWNVGTGRKCPSPGGWSLDDAARQARRGTDSESDSPYSEVANFQEPPAGAFIYKAGDVAMVKTVDKMKQALQTGPLVSGMEVFEDFYRYGYGVYRHALAGSEGYHAILIVGYDDAQGVWICQNSWSDQWGEAGMFRLAYNQVWDFGYLYTGVTRVQLQSIAVTPPTASVPAGVPQQFMATGTYSDGTVVDLTSRVFWSSSNGAIATVGAKGLATGVAEGQAQIQARLNGMLGSATLTVTPAQLRSLAITPEKASVPVGVAQAFTAMGTYSDGRTADVTNQVTWSLSDASIAAFSQAAGMENVAVGVSGGTTQISATLGNIVAPSVILTVTPARLLTLAITPPNPSVPVGRTQQFMATGTYSDGKTADLTAQVAWSSSDPAVAVVGDTPSSKGLATVLAVGSTQVCATLGAITAPAVTLTGTQAQLVSLAVTPASPSVPVGTTRQFTATGTYSDGRTVDLTDQVVWSSSDAAVALVSNAAGSRGLATGLAAGTTQVSATLDGIASPAVTLTVTQAQLTSIAVTPANPSVPAGLTCQFTATGTYNDGKTADLTGLVTWASSDPAKATISNATGSKGLATGLVAGPTTITATDPATGVNGTTTLTVTSATLASIAVTPANPSVPNGLTRQFVATGTYTDNSTQVLTAQVTWTSSDTAKATISNAVGSKGLATGLATGSTTITATDPATGINGTTTLTVSDARLMAIGVTPTNPTVPVGQTQQFVATGIYSDHSTLDITTQVGWSSWDQNTATISNAAGSKGLATPVAMGSTLIIATDYTTGVSGQTTLTVPPVDGTRKWQFYVNPTIVGYGPALGPDGTIYFGNDRGEVYAINPADGTTKWKAALPEGKPRNSPTVGPDGTIYVTHDRSTYQWWNPGILYALDPADGSVKWTVQRTGSETPAIGSDGYVYVSADDSKVAAINPADPTGFAWSYTMTGDNPLTGPVIGSDGTVYVRTWASKLRAIQYSPILGAAREKWAVNLVNGGGTGVRFTPAIAADGTIYVASNTTLHSINPAGSINWTYTYPRTGGEQNACVLGADGNVYVTSDRYLYSITPGATQGTLNWEYFSDNYPDTPAVASDGRIYFGAGGSVCAVTPAGSLLWKYGAAGTLRGFAIGGDGTIFGVTRSEAPESTVFALYGSFPLVNSPWPMYNRDPQHTGRQ